MNAIAATGILNSTSVRTRFLVSVVSNGSRAGLSLLAGLLVARGLDPIGYGNLNFLLVSFVATKSLLDLGTGNAFYTLISQCPRKRPFYLFYFGWQIVQFVIMVSFIAVICPRSLLTAIWLGQSRGLIALAFAATFAQQQMWQTVSQVGEGSRQSVRVQVMNLSIAAVHLCVIAACFLSGVISVPLVLWIMVGEYAVATIVSYFFLRERHAEPVQEAADFSLSGMLNEYWTYCKPLVVLSIVTFFYFFADRWMLQRFGGSRQQGFYQIASQFAAVSLLATTSILSIFWKEIAEAQARGDKLRVARLYTRVLRGLVMISAVLSGLLIPWTAQITVIFLGSAYSMAAPVLAVMFLYPIPQSMGQINGTMFLASGDTRVYTTLTIIGMMVSVPATYLIQAPPTAHPIPGLGGGAIGMGIKMVALAFATVNLQSWVISRHHGWKFRWGFQVAGIGSVLLLGYAARFLTSLVWPIPEKGIAVLPPFLCCAILYSVGVLALFWMFPWIAGLDRGELQQFSNKLRAQFA